MGIVSTATWLVVFSSCVASSGLDPLAGAGAQDPGLVDDAAGEVGDLGGAQRGRRGECGREQDCPDEQGDDPPRANEPVRARSQDLLRRDRLVRQFVRRRCAREAAARPARSGSAASSPASSASAVRPAARSGFIRASHRFPRAVGDALAQPAVRVHRGSPLEAAREEQQRVAAARREQLAAQEERLRLAADLGVGAQRLEEETGELRGNGCEQRGGGTGAEHLRQREQHGVRPCVTSGAAGHSASSATTKRPASETAKAKARQRNPW